MAVVYSASGVGFRILRLLEISYLIKSTTMGANNNPREVEKTEQTTCPCKVKLIMIGRKLECTADCNTEYMGLSMEVHTFTVAHVNSSSSNIDAGMLLMTFQ